MQLNFRKSGDFYYTTHHHAKIVASVLGVTLQEKNGAGYVGLAAHSISQCIDDLNDEGHDVVFTKGETL